MKKKMLSFTDPQWVYMHDKSEELGISPAELVRRALDDYREEHPMEERMRRGSEPKILVEVLGETEEGGMAPLKLYSHQGRGYIEGVDGQRYAYRVKNLSGKDIEVISSVDGLDVLTGKDAEVTGEGMIIPRGSSYLFQGFRLNHSRVATFRFGGIEESYAEQMGKPRNIGVIGIAVYRGKLIREKRREPEYTHHAFEITGRAKGLQLNCSSPPRGQQTNSTKGASPYRAKRGRAGGQGLSPQSLSMDSMHRDVIPDCGKDLSALEGMAGMSEASAISEERSSGALGTTFGEERSDQVRTCKFERHDEEPWQLLTIRYEPLDKLVELGIVTDEDLHERESADPFPANKPFCTPPPGWTPTLE